MPNPQFLLCDSDALIQFLIAGELRPFRELKRSYSVQPAIVSEVEVEIRSTKKFGSQFDAPLRKALSSETIRILDQTVLHAHLPPVRYSEAAPALWASIQSRGAQYRLHVGRGEAYTHAAAYVLGVPAMSNDRSALDTLEHNRYALPSCVLRGFDLLVFSYQIGILAEEHCDRFRQLLLQKNEGVPAAFKTASFVHGLTHFCPRLLDGPVSSLGAPASSGPSYARPLILSRTSTG